MSLFLFSWVALGNKRNAENCHPETPAGRTHRSRNQGCCFFDFQRCSDQFVPSLNPVFYSYLFIHSFTVHLSCCSQLSLLWPIPPQCWGNFLELTPCLLLSCFSASSSPLSLPHLVVSYLPGGEDSHSRAQSCPWCLSWSKQDGSWWLNGLMLYFLSASSSTFDSYQTLNLQLCCPF